MPLDAGLKTIAAVSSCKEKERKEGEGSIRKRQVMQELTLPFLMESIGKNLDTWPVIPLRETGKCGFHLGG